MSDQGFPHIKYDPSLGPMEWGLSHGEEFKEGIKELIEIRKSLILQKSPHLKEKITPLAQEQYEISKSYDSDLMLEFDGICKGAQVSATDLIILNNYTDFRDINLPDEGCTSVSVKREGMLSAQTWDMHSSAKKYVCTMELPGHFVTFSLVGCLGMMGVNQYGIFLGVNNINTQDARSGIIWSAFVRKILQQKNLDQGRALLQRTPFTSGHNYLLSDNEMAQHWEASPTRKAKASELTQDGLIFHTNHCLTPELCEIEETLSQNSTSKERFALIDKKGAKVQGHKDMIALLQDHEGYPKSLCGHFQSGAQDPSITCGGAAFDHQSKEFTLWRGCPKYDDFYKERTLTVSWQ